MPARHKYIERPAAPTPVFRLVFALPTQLALVAPGRHKPNPDGCQLEIEPSGLVIVTGPNRREVQEHAGRFLRQISKNRAVPIVIPGATLVTPPNYYSARAQGGRDGWTIVIGTGGEVTFAPTTVGVEVMPAAASE